MKNIIIKIFAHDNEIVKMYKILIYDSSNNLLYERNIKNSNVFFKGNINNAYKLKIIPNIYGYNKSLTTSFIIKKDLNIYTFVLDKDNLVLRLILKDNNYESLPIMKGVINLWQDHIQ